MKTFKVFYSSGTIQSIVVMDGLNLVRARCFDEEGVEVADFKTKTVKRYPKKPSDTSHWAEVVLEYEGSKLNWFLLMSFVEKPGVLEMTFERTDGKPKLDVWSVFEQRDPDYLTQQQQVESRLNRISLTNVRIPAIIIRRSHNQETDDIGLTA